MTGSSSYLQKTSAPDGLTGDITICCYIFPTYYVGYPAIFTNGKTKLFIGGGDILITRNNSTEASAGGSAIDVNEYTHIIITSTSVGITNIYINGVLKGTANQSAGTPESGTTYTFMNDITGVVVSPRIYDRILSAEEVALDYDIFVHGGID